MKTYLVGGAIRDNLLGQPVKERDWVVVGATKKDMENLNFKQVGRDFPVFIHPDTKEEYALARTERKTAKGYYGFACDFSKNVSLEDDLRRRDLTINAMAMADDGKVIDPFNGQDDLNNKILRHVSNAFTEDPLRVLRLARFYARFHHLGFTIAKETKSLVYDIVKNNELQSLVPERIWAEMHKCLIDGTVHLFIQSLRDMGALAQILPEFDALYGVPNDAACYKFIDCGLGSVILTSFAEKDIGTARVSFAVLLHQLGKADTNYNLWPRHDGYEHFGEISLEKLSKRLRIPNVYLQLAHRLLKFHKIALDINNLDAKQCVEFLEKMDPFRKEDSFVDFLQACDIVQKNYQKSGPVAKKWLKLLAICKAVTATQFLRHGLKGKAIKAAIKKERIAQVKRYLDEK